MNERNPYESDDTVDIPDFSSIKVNDDDIDRSVFKMNDDIPSCNEPEFDDDYYDDEEDEGRSINKTNVIMIAIMVVLVGVTAPMFISHIHKARVAKDWANLRSYYTEAQADFISTGEANSTIYKDLNIPDNWKRTEIEYLDGTKVKLLAGYFAVTMDTSGNGYHIAYQCNEYKAIGDKHQDCTLVLGATN